MDISDAEKHEHQRKVMLQINEELNSMQMRYDAKLLSLMLADRAAYLFSLLIKAGRMTEDEALGCWLLANDRILQQPETVTQLTMAGDDVYDPAKVN